MKPYIIVVLDDSKYTALVLSTSFESPITSRVEIANELDGNRGYVLFDLLLVNGQSSNRFIEGYFDGNKFLFNSFRATTSISQNIMAISSDFYHENIDLFKNSSLTNVEKFVYLNSKKALH